MGISANRSCNGANCGRGDDPGGVGGTASSYGPPSSEQVRSGLERGNQPGGRDLAGGGTLYAYSAKTRNAPRMSSDEVKSELSAGRTPNTAQGSKATFKITNASNAPAGGTMNSIRAQYRADLRAGMGADDARQRAIVMHGGTMSRDFSGKPVY